VRRFSDFDPPAASSATRPTALSSGRKGFSGVIVAIDPAAQSGGLGEAEVERRLLEMGFVEGAPVEIVHEGLIGRDPIAVRLADRTVALRRREAGAVLVRTLDPAK
jgi:ferrous iron transport protein A